MAGPGHACGTGVSTGACGVMTVVSPGSLPVMQGAGDVPGELAAHPQRLPQMAAQAAATSRAWFSRAVLVQQLRGLLDGTTGFGDHMNIE